MSKHFNDIWCWNLGEGEREHHSDRRKKIESRQNARAEGNILEEDWSAKEAPEKDILTESWSTTLFDLSTSSPTVANC